MFTGEAADISIEVKNSGLAIGKENLDHIFDPLRRAVVQEGDDSEAGLGLGLYIVREIAKAHGGEVTVRSDHGETVFAVRVPRRN